VLAPEVRFPGQIEQIDAVLEPLPDRLGLDARRIAIGGDSTGAHLALAVMLGAAGVPVEFTTYDGVLHGFLHLSRMVPKALDALRKGAAFLAARLSSST
jgi:acetyl esterase/lipase